MDISYWTYHLSKVWERYQYLKEHYKGRPWEVTVNPHMGNSLCPWGVNEVNLEAGGTVHPYEHQPTTLGEFLEITLTSGFTATNNEISDLKRVAKEMRNRLSLRNKQIRGLRRELRKKS